MSDMQEGCDKKLPSSKGLGDLQSSSPEQEQVQVLVWRQQPYSRPKQAFPSPQHSADPSRLAQESRAGRKHWGSFGRT